MRRTQRVIRKHFQKRKAQLSLLTLQFISVEQKIIQKKREQDIKMISEKVMESLDVDHCSSVASMDRKGSPKKGHRTTKTASKRKQVLKKPKDKKKKKKKK